MKVPWDYVPCVLLLFFEPEPLCEFLLNPNWEQNLLKRKGLFLLKLLQPPFNESF